MFCGQPGFCQRFGNIRKTPLTRQRPGAFCPVGQIARESGEKGHELLTVDELTYVEPYKGIIAEAAASRTSNSRAAAELSIWALLRIIKDLQASITTSHLITEKKATSARDIPTCH